MRDALAVTGAQALLVSHAPNIRYLTGFTGSAGLLLLTADRCVLVTDFRYATQAPAETAGACEVAIDQRNVWERLGKVMASVGPESVVVESMALTLHEADRLREVCRARLQPLPDLVERFRIRKAPEEVGAIRAAAALAHEALARVLPTIRVGDTEREIAGRLEAALRLLGSEWHPFPTIVASGPRSALPHARTSDRAVGRGEFLLIDFGAQLGGYCSDITRTVVVGARADERQRTIYEAVRAAQLRAREEMRPEMLGRDIDALARDLISARGFGEAFGHSLGHGLGLEVHEAPRLAPSSEVPIPLHAVVTVEPGIYLENSGGVRLEDDVHLGPQGPVLLSDGATNLLELS